eukprot:g2746.t1
MASWSASFASRGLMEILQDERRRAFEELRLWRRASGAASRIYTPAAVLWRHYGEVQAVSNRSREIPTPGLSSRHLDERLAEAPPPLLPVSDGGSVTSEAPDMGSTTPRLARASPAAVAPPSLQPKMANASEELELSKGRWGQEVTAVQPAVRPAQLQGSLDLDSRWGDLIERVRPTAPAAGKSMTTVSPPLSARSSAPSICKASGPIKGRSFSRAPEAKNCVLFRDCRLRPGEVGDVEAAGVEEPKSPRSVSSVSLSSETERSSTVEAVPSEDGEAIAEQVKAERWQCDLCFEPWFTLAGPWNAESEEPFLKFETPWQLGGECGHSLCRRCVLGSIRWGGRCPYDNTPIPAIVVCGAMGTGEYVYHEKLTEARRTGGVPCSVSDCPGVAPSTGTSGTRPSPSSCNCCGTRHCGRTVCGVPWSGLAELFGPGAGDQCPRHASDHARNVASWWSTPEAATWSTMTPAVPAGASYAGGWEPAKTLIARHIRDIRYVRPHAAPNSDRSRKALPSSTALLMAGMVLLFLLLTCNFFSGLRKGLPFFLSAAPRETCENLSCETSSDSTSSPPDVLLRPGPVSLEV